MRFRVFISIYAIFCLSSCNHKNDFYSYASDFDVYRIPICEPFELISSAKNMPWGIREDSKYNQYRFNVDSITVLWDSIVIIKSNNYNTNNEIYRY